MKAKITYYRCWPDNTWDTDTFEYECNGDLYNEILTWRIEEHVKSLKLEKQPVATGIYYVEYATESDE